jgi:hypothetical protein
VLAGCGRTPRRWNGFSEVATTPCQGVPPSRCICHSVNSQAMSTVVNRPQESDGYTSNRAWCDGLRRSRSREPVVDGDPVRSGDGVHSSRCVSINPTPHALPRGRGSEGVAHRQNRDRNSPHISCWFYPTNVAGMRWQTHHQARPEQNPRQMLPKADTSRQWLPNASHGRCGGREMKSILLSH